VPSRRAIVAGTVSRKKITHVRHRPSAIVRAPKLLPSTARRRSMRARLAPSLAIEIAHNQAAGCRHRATDRARREPSPQVISDHDRRQRQLHLVRRSSVGKTSRHRGRPTVLPRPSALPPGARKHRHDRQRATERMQPSTQMTKNDRQEGAEPHVWSVRHG